MNPRSVYINWLISGHTGWGVYGLNLALQWSGDPDLVPHVSGVIDTSSLALDPLRRRALDPLIQRSVAFHDKLKTYENRPATIHAPALNCFDERFAVPPLIHGARLSGTPTIGVTFFETTQLGPDAVERAAQYPVVVAGSTWNADILRAHGLGNVQLVLQGIDPTLFHPAERADPLAGRFLVFSGGKLERRKGQDIVVAAFRRFAERHAEALLVAAWFSPASSFAGTLDASGLTAPVPYKAGRNGAEQTVDADAWVRANGLDPSQFLDLGPVANALMPAVLREMDVGLFPNRAEGGTNLVAMECMACGVPVILSRNTGHLDLIEDDNCFPLVQQGALDGAEGPLGDLPGWGESDVDEVVEQLERVYAHRQEARARGLRGAALLAQYSWARTAAAMKDLVLSA